MKLTEWYPAHIKPVHVGYYQLMRCSISGERVIGFGGNPQWWDGYKWCHTNNHRWPLSFQDREWRGIAEEEKDEGFAF